MNEFAVYTGLRLLMLAGSFAIVAGIWLAVAESVPVLWALVIALVVSGVASYFLLNRQRELFARRVDERARKAATAFESYRTSEDSD